MTRTVIFTLVASLSLITALFVTQNHPEASTAPAPQTSLKPPAALHGTWLATGRVESSSGSPNHPAGTRLTRRWVFFTKCTDGRCEPWLARESAGGVEQARVERPDIRLSVLFTLGTQGCNTPETGKLTRLFRISTAATGGRLQATEAVRGVYPGCALFGGDGITQSSLSWKLRRLSPACPGLQDCREVATTAGRRGDEAS